jgi:hypothetical protein
MSEAPSANTERLFCTVHPTVETTLRCNKCGRPMCVKCARRTPVGYRCRECVRGQQQVFYTAHSLDLVLQGIVSLILGSIGAVLVGLIGGSLGIIGWLIAFGGGSAAGALIADVAHRVAGRRRGRYSWLVVAGGIVIGSVAVALIPMLAGLLFYMQALRAAPEAAQSPWQYLLAFGGLGSIGWWIYMIMATAAAIGRLRLGK